MDYEKIYYRLILKRRFNPIDKNKVSCSCEYHHIKPLKCDGPDTADNIVLLTAREHYFAHRLILRITMGTKYEIPMSYAWWRMTYVSKKDYVVKITSRLFQIERDRVIKNIKLLFKGKIRITNEIQNKMISKDQPIPDGWRIGAKPMSKKGRKNLSKSLKGRKHINNGISNRVLKCNENIPDGWCSGNKPLSEEHKKHVSEGLKKSTKNKNIVRSEKWCKCHSECMKGRKLTLEHKQSISKALKGRKLNQTPERRLQLQELGRQNGKKQKGKPKLKRRGITPWNKGMHMQPMSEIQKTTISKTMAGKKRITNGYENRTINLDDPMPVGFWRG